jgi:hypothetical protein
MTNAKLYVLIAASLAFDIGTSNRHSRELPVFRHRTLVAWRRHGMTFERKSDTFNFEQIARHPSDIVS